MGIDVTLNSFARYSKEKLPYLDKSAIIRLAKYRTDRLTKIMKLATHIGDGYVWASVCIALFFINIPAATALSIASVLQIIIQQIVKHIFSRNRPFVDHNDIFYIIPPPDKFSFPSGHTAAAFVMVFFAFQFYPPLLVFMLPLACIIAVSRVYLGLHYPTDLLGGVGLGYISYKMGIWLSVPLLSIY